MEFEIIIIKGEKNKVVYGLQIFVLHVLLINYSSHMEWC